MKKNSLVVFIFFLSVYFVMSGKAQEVRLPIDEEGNLEYIDDKLEKELNLFPDYVNFQKAWIFQVSDTTFVLEVFYRSREELLKARLLLSEEEVQNLRRKVTERIRVCRPRSVLDQRGRMGFIVGTTSLSLGYYGWAIPIAFGVEDQKLTVAIYMLTSAGGFFIPFWVTNNIPVTDAQSVLSLYGGTRGIVHGILLSNLFCKEEVDGRTAMTAGVISSLVEGVSGFIIADRLKIPPGRAEVIGVGGDFGLCLGVGVTSLGVSFAEKRRLIATGGLVGSGVGFLVGKVLSDMQSYTPGDARVLRAAGILGAYVPLAIVGLTGTDDDKIYVQASMVGSVIGLGLGHILVKEKDFSSAHGSLITLSSVAGGLFGAGLAFLAAETSSSDYKRSTLYFISSALGAASGFWVTYRSFARDAQISKGNSSWNINIRPEGLIGLAMGEGINSGWQTTSPLIQIDCRF